MNEANVKALIGYIVLQASSSEGRLREVSTREIAKLLYLADVAHAKKHRGKSFTEVPWLMHHFGPFDTSIYEGIASSAKQFGFNVRTMGDDTGGTSYGLYDDDQKERLAQTLPVNVMLEIDRLLRNFRGDSSGLVNHSYNTKPVLCAGPGQLLDLTLLADESTEAAEEVPTLTHREKKKLKERLEAGRAEFVRRQEAWRNSAATLPRLTPDEERIIGEGIALLDLDDDPAEPKPPIEITVTDEFWEERRRNAAKIP